MLLTGILAIRASSLELKMNILNISPYCLCCCQDWGVQAIVSWLLSESFGSHKVSIVAEEDIHALSDPRYAKLLSSVVEIVNECLDEASRFGLQKPSKALGTSEVLEAIERCNATGGPRGRFWVLDPVDGTLGFVRGNQYAVALALIEDGQVVIGVLGCPNYPLNKELLSYHHQPYQNSSKLTLGPHDLREKGCVMYAKRGSGRALMQPIVHQDMQVEWPSEAKLIRVSSIDDPAMATFCEPVEKAHSNQSFTAGLAHTVGLRYATFPNSLARYSSSSKTGLSLSVYFSWITESMSEWALKNVLSQKRKKERKKTWAIC